MINIDKLFAYKYLKLEPIEVTDSFFWQKRLPATHWGQLSEKSFALLFLPIKQSGENKKEILMINREQKVTLKLPNRNAKGKKLMIFPQFYVYQKQYCCIYEICKMSKITNLQQCFMQLMQMPELTGLVFCQVEGKGHIIEQLNRNLKTLYAQQKAQRLIEDFFQKMEQDLIKTHAQELYYVQEDIIQFSFFINISCSSKIALFAKMQQIKQVVHQYQGQIEQHLFEQRRAIEIMFLAKESNKKDEKKYLPQQLMPEVFPYAQLGLYDIGGGVIGKDNFNNKVIFNIWIRDMWRVNSNFIIVGQSGMGKTTLLKTLIHIQKPETEILLIDPENEYADMFQHQPKYQKYDINNKVLLYNLLTQSSLTDEQEQFLSNHFKTVTNADYQLQAVFETLLLTFKKEQSSLFIDFVIAYVQQASCDPIILQYFLAMQDKQVLTLNPTATLHHFIVTALMNNTNVQMQMIMFELLFCLWQLLTQNQLKNKMLLIDESYFLFDQNNYIVVELLRNIIKRARKYNIAIGLISQNLADFMNPKIAHLLLPIIDNCTYKFIFRLGDYDLQAYQQLLHLSETEFSRFQNLQRGMCFLTVGNNYGRMEVKKYEI